jgi:hypothetical protein
MARKRAHSCSSPSQLSSARKRADRRTAQKRAVSTAGPRALDSCSAPLPGISMPGAGAKCPAPWPFQIPWNRDTADLAVTDLTPFTLRMEMDMRTAIATREAVFGAADAIAAAGGTPTVERVREKLGGGSYSTINGLLQEWTSLRRSETARARELPADIEALAHDLAIKAASEIYARVVESSAAQIAAVREDAVAKVAEAQDQVADAVEEVARLETMLETADRERASTRADAADALIRATSAEGQVIAQGNEIARLAESLTAVQMEQRQAESAAAELRGQLTASTAQIVAIREDAAAKVAEATAELSRLDGMIEIANREKTKARTDAADAVMRATSAEGQVTAKDHEIARLADSLAKAQMAQRKAESDAAELRGQILELRQALALAPTRSGIRRK